MCQSKYAALVVLGSQIKLVSSKVIVFLVKSPVFFLIALWHNIQTENMDRRRKS